MKETFLESNVGINSEKNGKIKFLVEWDKKFRGKNKKKAKETDGDYKLKQ